MKIQYLGHSCFRLISDTGTTVVCDPYKSSMVGLNMPAVRCDVVTVSHGHDDHACLENVIGNPPVLDEEISCCADDISISAVSTFHDDVKGAKRGKNLVFTFNIDGFKVAHLGDVGCLDESVANALAGFDVIMLPVGGIYTVNAAGAKWYVDKIKPQIVVPMHYMTEKHKFQLDGLDGFLSLFDREQIRKPSTYNLTLLDFPHNEKPQIVVLEELCD